MTSVRPFGFTSTSTPRSRWRMKTTGLLLGAALTTLVVGRCQAAAPPTPEPLKGVVASGAVLVGVKTPSHHADNEVYVWFVPLRGAGRPTCLQCSYATDEVPPRLHVGYGAVFVSNSMSI